MFSVFKIFNPKNWKKANIFGRLGNFFRAIPSRAKGAWASFSKFAIKNKGWFLGIGGSVAAAFIVKGLSNLFSSAEQAEDHKKRLYPGLGDGEVARRIRNKAAEEMIEALNSLRYGTITDYNRTDPQLVKLIKHYHIFIHNFDEMETLDFAVTTNDTIGAAANAGVTFEDPAESAYVVSRFRVERDNEEDPRFAESALIGVIDMDQTGLPLKMI